MSLNPDAPAPPVVLVHGFPLDHTMWQGQIDRLAGTFQVLAPDLRGFGQSEPSPGTVTMDQFADDLAAMLDRLGIERPVVMAGLSMGGYIAQRFFERYRARLAALILCDTRAAADAPEAAASRRALADRVEREGPAVLANTMIPKLLAPSTFQEQPEVVERLQRMILGGNATGIAAAARGLAERPDFTELLPRIDCPTLAIVGREDAISPPAEMRAMVERIAGARLVEIDGAGHLAPMERPAEVAEAMEGFLRDLSGN